VFALGDYLHVRAYLCMGGTDTQKDRRELREGQQVVVGTPGRIAHLRVQRADL